MVLAVASANLDRAHAVVKSFYDRGLTDEERRVADIVMDFNADEVTCPACLTTFANEPPLGPERCPECDLNLRF